MLIQHMMEPPVGDAMPIAGVPLSVRPVPVPDGGVLRRVVMVRPGNVELIKTLRNEVQSAATESLSTIMDALLGRAPMTDRVKEVIRVVALGIKAGHMDQLAEQANRSFALRLLPHLPKEVNREDYIKATNPQVAPLMLQKPKKQL